MDSAVFLVDDDLSFRRALVRLLNSRGYKAKAYASAHEFLGERLPDVPTCLILDLKMPEVDGSFSSAGKAMYLRRSER